MINIRPCNPINGYLYLSDNTEYEGQVLKMFTNFLKRNFRNNYLNFSFIGNSDGLIDSLTIIQNILMHNFNQTFDREKENDFHLLLKDHKNIYIKQLYQSIDYFDKYPFEVTDEEKKLITILSGILQQKNYLILSRPERYLSINNINLVKNILRFVSTNSETIILIESNNKNLWKKYISKSLIFDKEKRILNTKSISKDSFDNILSFPSISNENKKAA